MTCSTVTKIRGLGEDRPDEFHRGFECGRIIGEMESRRHTLSGTIDPRDEEIIWRACKYYRYNMQIRIGAAIAFVDLERVPKGRPWRRAFGMMYGGRAGGRQSP